MNEREELAALTLLAARTDALVKLVFSRPVAGDIERTVGTLRRVSDQKVIQLESFYADHKARHENLAIDDAARQALAARFAAFAQVNLITSGGDAEYRVNKKGKAVLLGAEKLNNRLLRGEAKALAVGGNNNEKKHILNGSEPFLRRLGVADENGRIYDKKQAKFRQINRFLELLSDVMPHLPEGDLAVADLCCGKSYLSFAVYHYLTAVCHRRVTMTGVDLKQDVIAYCAEVARDLHFEGLTFVCGDVAAFEAERIDLVVSLHACDTATDLVLDRALAARARVNLATPCCHHELNHTLNCPPLAFIAEHSMLRQKFCDAATDALRLKRLEAEGYDVAALELIDPDDTPKNILLRAVRRPDAARDTERKRQALAAYTAARAFLLGGS